ncbi:hypothetical protein WCLP8_3080019 [uncultured Gammaproteobacteria bacterium]
MTTPALQPKSSCAAQWLVFALAAVVLGGLIGYPLDQEHARIDRQERERLLNHGRMVSENLSHQLDAT